MDKGNWLTVFRFAFQSLVNKLSLVHTKRLKITNIQ